MGPLGGCSETADNGGTGNTPGTGGAAGTGGLGGTGGTGGTGGLGGAPGTVPAGNRPVSVTVDPTGKFAYVANQFSDDVSQYRIETNGTLSALSPATIAAGGSPVSITVDPTGQFAYVANQLSDDVSQYGIEANGTLSLLTSDPLTPNPVGAGDGPFSVAVDPSGKFAYVANSGSDNVSQYSIGTDGRLSPLL